MTRRQWALIVTGYLVLAAAWIAVGAIVISEINRLDDTQQQIKNTQAALGTSVVHNAGAICLIALAPTKQHEMDIVRSYLGGQFLISELFGPECAEVARRAKNDIFTRNGRPIPDSLGDDTLSEP